MGKLFLLILVVGAAYIGYLAQREKPGVGPKGRQGKILAQPVIVALDAYHAAHNVYPPDIEDLSSEGGGLPSQIDGNPVRYERYGATYNLTFSYATPLPVHCTYNPETHWKCGYLRG